jgi:hypothetical protein
VPVVDVSASSSGSGASSEVQTEVRVKPGAGGRATVLLLVQRSTIDLFAAYGVAVAPMAASDAPASKVSDSLKVGTVQVSTATHRGQLALGVSQTMLERTNPRAALAPLDWLRELTNQLAGRVANRFARYRVPMVTSLPNALASARQPERAAHVASQAPALCVHFHALRDSLEVRLTGGFEHAELSPNPLPGIQDEGDITLF